MEMNSFPALSALLRESFASIGQPGIASACRDLFLSTIEREIQPSRRQLQLFADAERATHERQQLHALVDAGLGIMNVATYALRTARPECNLWRDAADLLAEGGRLLELGHSFLGTRADRGPRGLALDVALAYQVCGQLPRSYVAARWFLEETDKLPMLPVGSLRRFRRDVLRAVAHFLCRDLQALEQDIHDGVIGVRDDLASRMNELLRTGRASLWHVARFVSLYDLAVGLHRLSQFLRTGDADAAQDAQRLIASAADMASEIHSPVDLWIASQVQLAAQEAQWSSIWRQLGERPSIPDSYLELLAHGAGGRPIYELWLPQSDALAILQEPVGAEEGVGPTVCPCHSVVALPTGAGKSLIAELAMVEQLSAHPGGQCAYVVPTRSLAAQASRDLATRPQQLGLRVVSLEDSPIVRVHDTGVFVCTPEKLNSLLGRVGSGAAPLGLEFDPSGVKLVVVDEAHLVGDQGRRGLLLEMLIVRLRRLCPSASILLLSAVVSNAQLLSRWLNGQAAADGEHSLSADWSPSGLLYGVLRPDNTLEYENGASVAVPRLPGCNSRAVRLVVQYCLRRRLKTLVLVNRQDRAGQVADKVASLRPPPERPDSEQLAGLIDSICQEFEAIGLQSFGGEQNELAARMQELPLVRCLQRRVAFHHAALPRGVRAAIENAVRQGEIDVVVATTTLAEGLNLPMNCVVVADLDFWNRDTSQHTAMSKMQCRNIVGRAGRPFEDTWGEAIVIAPKRTARLGHQTGGASSIERAKSYWVRDTNQLEPVRSSFRALCAEVRRADGDGLGGELALVYQGQLLAALQEGVVDAADPASFLSQTLLAREPDGAALLAALLEHTRAQLRYIQGTVESESLPAFRRTGLTVAACLEMQRRIEANLASDPQFYRIRQVGRKRHEAAGMPDPRGRELLSLAFVPSAPRGVQDPVSLLCDWISGDSVATISGRHFGNGGGVDRVLGCSYMLEREIRPNAAWALSGFRVLLDDWKQRKDNSVEYTSTVALMPRYVDYGVNHPVAVYMLDIGAFQRRDDALTVAYAFDDTEQLTYDAVADFHFTLNWMKRAEYRALAEYTSRERAEQIHGRLREYGRAVPGERADVAEQGYV